MGIFVGVKPHKRHRVVVVAETRGPRSAKQQRAFREAIKRLFEENASVMLPPKNAVQRRAFKEALTTLLATNLAPERARAKRTKPKR
jgi:tyrosyl-tRNA synthetase